MRGRGRAMAREGYLPRALAVTQQLNIGSEIFFTPATMCWFRYSKYRLRDLVLQAQAVSPPASRKTQAHAHQM